MTSISSSPSHTHHASTRDHSQRFDTKHTPQPFFAPILQWLLLTSIVLSVLLMTVFCTQPMSVQTLISDFQAGVAGVQVFFL